RIIRTLATQLVLDIPDARTRLQKLKDDEFKDLDSVPHMLQHLLKNSLAGVTQDVFIVIDGLDECDIGNAPWGGRTNAIENLLEGLTNLDAKLLVLSRPTPEISRTIIHSMKWALTYEDSREDIQGYVTMRVSQ